MHSTDTATATSNEPPAHKCLVCVAVAHPPRFSTAAVSLRPRTLVRSWEPYQSVMSLPVLPPSKFSTVVPFHSTSPRSSPSSRYFQAASSPRSLSNHAARHILPPRLLSPLRWHSTSHSACHAVPTSRLFSNRVYMVVSQQRSTTSVVSLPFRVGTLTVAVANLRTVLVVNRRLALVVTTVAPLQAREQLSPTAAADAVSLCTCIAPSSRRVVLVASTSYCHDHLSHCIVAMVLSPRRSPFTITGFHQLLVDGTS